MQNEFGIDRHATSPAKTHSEFEEGWYYYLADIAARRILQRVISSSYGAGESAWLDVSLQCLLQTAEELDRQLMEWYVESYVGRNRTVFLHANLGIAHYLTSYPSILTHTPILSWRTIYRLEVSRSKNAYTARSYIAAFTSTEDRPNNLLLLR